MTAAATLLLLGLAVASCKDLQTGVEAYHEGSYEKALHHLDKVKKEYRLGTDDIAAPFTIEVKLGKNETLDDVLIDVTDAYFQFWQAYTGSMYGLGRLAEGCTENERALRPLKFKIEGRSQPELRDPKVGDDWQTEVFTLRTWMEIIRCPLEGGFPSEEIPLQ